MKETKIDELRDLLYELQKEEKIKYKDDTDNAIETILEFIE